MQLIVHKLIEPALIAFVAPGVAGTNLADIRLPDFNLYTTFYLRVQSGAAFPATVPIGIRFGFTRSEAANSTQGVDFPAVFTAANQVFTANQEYGPAGTALPGIVGNNLGVLPPWGVVRQLGVADQDVTFNISWQCVEAT